MEYIVFKVLGIIGALVLVAIDVIIIWCGILKLKDFILKRKHGKLFLYYQGRADAIEEFVAGYIADENYDNCKGCERMDDYCCIQCFKDRFLEQLKEKQNG